MYDMFSAAEFLDFGETSGSYWLINSSKNKNYVSFVTYNGMPYSGDIDINNAYGARVVGYFKKDITIQKGLGTHKEPYVVK